MAGYLSIQFLLGFTAKLERSSQLNNIIKHMKKKSPNLNAKFLWCNSFLSAVVDSELAEPEEMTRCKFLSDQMEWNTYENFVGSYPSNKMKDAV